MPLPSPLKVDENQLQDDICPIHDNDSSHDIYPRAEIISLSEYNVENEKLHKLILKHSIGGGPYKNYIEELAKIPTNEVISEDLDGKIEYVSIGSIVVSEDNLPLHTKQEFDECKLFDRSLKRILERKLKQRNYFK